MDVRQIVGENVRRYRREKGLSQQEVANRMGVDRAYVSGLELGQRNPTVVTLWPRGAGARSGSASAAEG
jgi:transcriptional regulator with XRE-family HTH domain